MYAGDAQLHQLYVSMGSGDPADGDFELVADLEYRQQNPDLTDPTATGDFGRTTGKRALDRGVRLARHDRAVALVVLSAARHIGPPHQVEHDVS